MREDTTILAVDMCFDGVPHYITYDAKHLPDGAGITITEGGYKIKVGLVAVKR